MTIFHLFLIPKRKMGLGWVWWLIAFAIIFPAASYAGDIRGEDARINIELTQDEVAWIDAHKTVRIGVDPGFAPFEFFSGTGIYSGLTADYVTLICETLGIRFEPVSGISWEEAVERARQGEIDVLPCVGITRERKSFLTYSNFYLEFPRVIVVQTGSDIASLGDLKNKKVGVQVRSSHMGFVAEETDYEPVVFETFQETLQALSRGDVDGVIGNMAVVTYNIEKYNLTNLKIAAHATKKLSTLSFGIRKDWPVLVTLINKCLAAMPEEKRIAISRKWMADPERRSFPVAAGLISLTEEEQLFLEGHQSLRVGIDPSYPPFEWLDDKGVNHGITSDYMKLIENRLGLSLKIIPLPTWSLVLDSVQNHTIDVVACISQTPSRDQYIDFTQPYLSFPVVIITRTKMPFISGLRDLGGKKISIVKDYAPFEAIARDYPGLNVSLCNSAIEGLKAVSLGGSDTYIGNLAVCIYLMQSHNIANLKVAAPAEGVASSDLSMGVRSDWAELAGILDKALRSITQEEQSRIVKKWVSVRFEHAADWGRVIRVVAIFLFVAGGIFFFFLYWNRKLAKEITFRRQIEKELETSKNKTEKALADLQTAQHQLIQSEKMAALGVLVAGVVHEINNPVNFIKTSVIGLEQDIQDIEKLLKAYETHEMRCGDSAFRHGCIPL